MENETYKNATEILKKYAPSRLHKLDEVEQDQAIDWLDGGGDFVNATSLKYD